MEDNQSAAPAAVSDTNGSAGSLESQIEGLDSNESSGDKQAAPAEAPKAVQAEIKKTLKKLKIKFNGKEMEEDLPFEIPDDEKSRDYMTKQLQMSKLSQSKAQEAAQLEKEVRSFIEELKKNPRKILSDPSIGVDLKKLATEMIEEEIANSQKSPEQLAKEKLENELKSIKEEREKEKEEAKKREFERVQEEAYERYDLLMSQAIEKSELPKSPYVVKKMADYMLLGLQNNLDVAPDDIIPLVKEEIKEDIKQMFAVMPEDVVEQIIGKDVLNKLRKKQLAKAKTAPVSASKSIKDTGKTSGEEKTEKGKKMSFRDFFGT